MWKDKSGRFEVEATYVSQTEDAVKIQKQDGSIATVPVAKLSQQDRDYLTSLSLQASSSESSGLRPESTKELSVDRSSVRLIRLADVQPGPPPAMATVESGGFSGASKTIAIANSEDLRAELARFDRFGGFDSLDGFGELTRLETAANGSKGIALWNAEKLSSEKQRLLAFDAGENEIPAPITLMRNQHVFDIEPDRGLVIIGGKRDAFIAAKRLSISRVQANTITPILEWSPYREGKIDGKQLHMVEVEAAWFLEGTRILTKSQVGRLWTIWRQQVTWGVATVIQMRPNDTPEAAVARAQVAEVARVIPARIPKKIARPGTATKDGAYGSSRVTSEGLLGSSK